MRWNFLLASCGLLLLVTTLNGYAQPLQLNTSIKPPFSTAGETGFFDLLLKELFSRAGLEIELIRLPAERALLMADEGLSDGDIPRIKGLQEKYPNLLMVPEPVVDYNFVAFSQAPAISDLSWEKMSGHRVGQIIGWKIYEKNVPPDAILTKVATPEQLMHLLNSGRVSLALYERYAGKFLIKAKHYQGIVEAEPPLTVMPMYLYLHKKHADLVGRLSEELRKMKADGSWQRIAVQTLGL